jgi:hypothetical protein
VLLNRPTSLQLPNVWLFTFAALHTLQSLSEWQDVLFGHWRICNQLQGQAIARCSSSKYAENGHYLTASACLSATHLLLFPCPRPAICVLHSFICKISKREREREREREKNGQCRAILEIIENRFIFPPSRRTSHIWVVILHLMCVWRVAHALRRWMHIAFLRCVEFLSARIKVAQNWEIKTRVGEGGFFFLRFQSPVLIHERLNVTLATTVFSNLADIHFPCQGGR